ncbi:hypothetical protein F0562_009910 [Nyssa sinensis]|uniref:Uncharacterized protein n=1 Tax=Nyssa sinensis TaxID=561372 RepID=A0A5J5A2D1_9ASTE|nr:hypothetical protein F0562_009910 [Nyssa sinensis]
MVMDLESECSTPESVEDNEVITPERLGKVDETKIENNGSCGGEQINVDEKLLTDIKGKDVEVIESVNSSPLSVKSPSGFVGSSLPTVTKGGACRVQQQVQLNLRICLLRRSKRVVVGPTFAAGTDSENSEDWSSKSSTAASAPHLTYEIPAVVGYAHEKNRMKNPGGKNLGNLVTRGQQGKSRTETSKKPRGERVKIEKENSHSSMESDSRSSNFVSMQGTNSVTSNGIQSERSMNYDGENSDEVQDGEQQFSKEIRTGFGKENVGEFEDLSPEDLAADLSWEVKEEKSDNHRSSADWDPLVESILTLQSTQEALEKEVQKLREIGKEHISQFYDSTPG